MKRLWVIAFVVLALGSGVNFLYSCGGGGGGGDASATYYADADGDGFGDVNDSQILDSAQAGWVLDSTDCDDDPAYGYSINTAAEEACDDWTDNDCDDLVDCYDIADCGSNLACADCIDSDVDDYYAVTLGCSGGNDCADADSTVNPGVDVDGDTINACDDCDDFDTTTGTGTAEVCNDFDDDCDGTIDEDWISGGTVTYTDLDGTTGLVKNDSCGVGACSGGTVICGADEVSLTCDTESAAGTESCDGIDNDCDGVVDDGFDVDSDGYTTCAGDCDDADPAANPAQSEVCNSVDDDCDGQTDEPGSAGCTVYYRDQDADTYGVTGDNQCLCGPSGTYTAADNGDCNDSLAAIHPFATEACDGLDNDCDGSTDEDFLSLGASCAVGIGICARTGTFICAAGGAGTECNVLPGSPATETCDGLDNDCDGETDESYPGEGGSCDGADADLCAEGTLSCSSGSLVCSDNTGDNVEVCNGLDDDCDGTPDEGDLCGAYVCQSGSCLTSCSSDSDCTSNYWCDGSNTCQAQKSLGDSCASSSECASGFCVDGVCCDTSCDSTCISCVIAGNIGSCIYLDTGTDPDAECAGTNVCDGAGGCTAP